MAPQHDKQRPQDDQQDRPNWLLGSWAWRKARGLVDATLASPEKLTSLINRAQNMDVLKKDGRFGELLETISASFRLIRAYAGGQYRDVSLQSIGLLVAALIYFVMPFDVVPDFIIALGFADDAALLAWALRAIGKDIERFIRWESGDAQDGDDPASSGRVIDGEVLSSKQDSDDNKPDR